jgi:hypothetical protein
MERSHGGQWVRVIASRAGVRSLEVQRGAAGKMQGSEQEFSQRIFGLWGGFVWN